jgi:hypothetical protein
MLTEESQKHIAKTKRQSGDKVKYMSPPEYKDSKFGIQLYRLGAFKYSDANRYAIVHADTRLVLGYDLSYSDAIRLRKLFREFEFVIDVAAGTFTTKIGGHDHVLTCYLRFQ